MPDILFIGNISCRLQSATLDTTHVAVLNAEQLIEMGPSVVAGLRGQGSVVSNMIFSSRYVALGAIVPVIIVEDVG